MDYTVEQLQTIIAEAKAAAKDAAEKFFQERLGGEDKYSCGFAWVTIPVKGNTRLGRRLKQAGLEQSYYTSYKTFGIWNPSGHPAQNVDTKEVGARAAAEVLNGYGIKAYPGSRLD